MFCPGCGSNNSVEQKFCRSCGMNLEGSAASLLEQFPDGTRSDLKRQERNLERFGSIVFTGFGIMVCIFVIVLLYAILTNMILSGTQPFFGALAMAFIIFAALTLTYVIRRESLNEKRQKLGVLPDTNSLPGATTGKLLEGSTIEPVPSVVEHTTELLTRNKAKDPNRS